MSDDETRQRVYGSDDTSEIPLTRRLAAAVRSVTPVDGDANPGVERHQRVVRIDPWSVTRVTFVLSIALGIAMLVTVFVLWWVLGAIGVWDSINRSVDDVVGSGSTWNIGDYLGFGRVFGFTLVVAVSNVVLMTATATLGAYLYNLASEIVGGVNLTVSNER